ncbi:MAG: hypothetical protein PUC98_02900 [Clostridiales bacterium]|nr:hypothetical protein [Clostridiales bacterium]
MTVPDEDHQAGYQDSCRIVIRLVSRIAVRIVIRLVSRIAIRIFTGMNIRVNDGCLPGQYRK